MLTSFKLFIRSFRRNKLFSVINILGLTVGFFASILIYLYVQNELSYDQFHENGEQIYRVNQTFIWGEDNPNQFASTGPGVGYAISEEIPEARQIVRIHTPEMMPVRFKDKDEEKFFNDEYVLAADSNFFEVFTYPLLKGDKYTVLDKPNSMVLTEKVAKRYFGNEDPVGKLIDLAGGPIRQTFVVTGVVADKNQNSYIDFDILISLNSIDRVKRSNWSWMWTTFETFILLEKGTDPDQVRAKLNHLPEKHAIETLEVMGYTYEEYIAAGKEWNLYLQPFQDIHLHSSNIYSRLSEVGDFKIVAALIGSAFFLVILSCINFINLSTAQFTTRAKDVALRKVLGGSKSAFIKRFFGESLAYCLIAIFVALAVLFYTIPFINQAMGTDLSLSLMKEPVLIVFVFALVLLVSAVAGLYPFIFFNSFNPTSAMKGEMRSGKRGLRLRNGMLVTQYVLSFLLIIGTITIYKQLNHFMNADMGFSKDNLMIVENAHWSGSQEELADEIANLDGVTGTAVCDATPMIVYNGDRFMPDKPEGGSLPLNYVLGDDDYIKLLEIEMAVGRSFDPSFSDDVNGIVINETAARTIGWAVNEDILNRKITNWSGTYHIIGVAKDFNFLSLHSPIEPFAIFHSNSNAQGERPLTRIMVKSHSTEADFKQLLTSIEEKWNEFAPGRPFEHLILSDHFERTYQTEERFGSVLSFFALLTIIIASLGLFGIVVFTIEQKLKEIGVRKVLGASISSIVVLFSRSYVKLLIVAFCIAAPFGYYFMNIWLSDFEYKINMSAGIFLMALGILLIISLVICIVQTAKASLMNPSEVLKDE
ncbi:putative ABC transport system permease protein [Ekhidna lutea]|uniref:Putative ABC transport system permease protein n=1 Tax=Ekhidna lutea TaxID=447679 RepID=A0A239GLA2_EKHLU|nr:ABC transporter permease [Ekhidna lutea]SNS68844.1 putative ABC transport system permease protein [Ekhidna lutea]